MQTVAKESSAEGSVEWSRPKRMTVAYTKMQPTAVMLLSFGLESLIALWSEKGDGHGYKLRRRNPLQRKCRVTVECETYIRTQLTMGQKYSWKAKQLLHFKNRNKSHV